MMTKCFTLILAMLFFVGTATAQQGINYKAIIHDDNGDPLANTSITVQFTILANGTTTVYQESHNPATDANGIIVSNIGEGTPISGDFKLIDWGNNPHFLKTEVDIGDGYTNMGTVEFKTVPYALHAETAKRSITNPNILASLHGDTLLLGDGNHIIIPGISVPNRKSQILFQSDIEHFVQSVSQVSNGYLIVGHSYESAPEDPFRAGYNMFTVFCDSEFDIYWIRYFGGSEVDYAYSALETPEGDFLICGATVSQDGDITNPRGTSGYDAFVIKLSSDGNIIWAKNYGGSRSDYALSLINVDDGYLLTGWSNSIDGDFVGYSDLTRLPWIFKLNTNGEIQWSKKYGDEYGEYNKIIEAEDSGFLVLGSNDCSNSPELPGEVLGDNSLLTKIDSDGNSVWARAYGEYGFEVPSDLIKDRSNNYIMCGTGPDELFLTNLNASGDTIWSHSYNRYYYSDFTEFESIVNTIDNSYVICGNGQSISRYDDDYTAMKFDNDGNVLWFKAYGGSDYESCKGIIEEISGNLIVVGDSGSSNGDVFNNNPFLRRDIWIVHLDEDGNIF